MNSNSTEVQKYRSTEVQKDYNSTIYFGNYYGLHDGYDGSVFSIYGLSKTITASIGGIASILVITE